MIVLLFTALPLNAQVNIGDESNPHAFSVLELTAKLKKGGLRLPLLTTTQRDELSLDVLPDPSDALVKSKGLVIFNTTTKCLEFWNGAKWLSLCTDVLVPPEGVSVTPYEVNNLPLGHEVTLKAIVLPENATNIQYQWEMSYDCDDNWIPLVGETLDTLQVKANTVETICYRVEAYNDLASVTSNAVPVSVDMLDGGGTNPNVQMYVGAFWRADQKGERNIQFGVGADGTNNGNWTAAVVWYDDQWDPRNANPDGVELENNNSPRPFPIAGDAEGNPVIGGSQAIGGTVANGGTISFRIGLDKNFAKYDSLNNPARYAVVLLTYNNGNKWYKLFIRQGQGPDYVMRNGDPGTNLPAGGRTLAAKFSPYNLCDPNGATPSSLNANNPAIPLGVGGARFTNYPTKAGYFFEYFNTSSLAPDNPSGTIGGWPKNANQLGTNYWNTSWETCPNGYRRPNDGNNTAFSSGNVNGSEIRQSLWANPPASNNTNSDNSIWGYYADGYFDRSQPITSLGTSATPLSAVATNSVNVAYAGRLFFNPISNASLFFPSGGYRESTNGTLLGAGRRARYWSSTSYTTLYDAWFLYIYSYTDGTITSMAYDDEVISGANVSKIAGAFVRCVKATP